MKVNTQNYTRNTFLILQVHNQFALITDFLYQLLFLKANTVLKFLKCIFRQQEQINQMIKEHFNKKIKMTLEDEKNYQDSHDCWVCNEKLDVTKVKDHCHITGKYRGAAHNQCNLKLKIPKKLNVFLHLVAYDGHLVFKELNIFNNIDIQVIPKTSENYMSIIVNRNIVILDSNQFYKGKFDSHASNLEDNDFKHFVLEFSLEKLEILKRKDAYRYEWVDSFEKFNYQELPPKECFYSSLKDGKRYKSDGHISDEQYLH